MKVGYVRVSTQQQHTARQDVLMESLGVDRVYTDIMSGKDTDRPELQKMMDFVREGDTVIRRTYATFLNRAGVEDQVIAKLLGHEDADKETSGAVACQHYILPDDEKMKLKKQEAVKKFMDYVGDLFDKNIDLEFIKSA